MDQEDLELEERVWQRIGMGGNSMGKQDHLHGLMLRAESAAADYRRMAMLAAGQRRERLLKLRQQELEDAAALRGMLILAGGNPGKMKKYAPAGESLSRMLARTYRQCEMTHRDYLAMEEDGDYGCVFRHLAEQSARQMQVLLELIGEGEKSNGTSV